MSIIVSLDRFRRHHLCLIGENPSRVHSILNNYLLFLMLSYTFYGMKPISYLFIMNYCLKSIAIINTGVIRSRDFNGRGCGERRRVTEGVTSMIMVSQCVDLEFMLVYNDSGNAP